jgi:hypothetical protein
VFVPTLLILPVRFMAVKSPGWTVAQFIVDLVTGPIFLAVNFAGLAYWAKLLRERDPALVARSAQGADQSSTSEA